MEKIMLFLEKIAGPVLWPTLFFMVVLVIVLLYIYFFHPDQWNKHF